MDETERKLKCTCPSVVPAWRSALSNPLQRTMRLKKGTECTIKSTLPRRAKLRSCQSVTNRKRCSTHVACVCVCVCVSVICNGQEERVTSSLHYFSTLVCLSAKLVPRHLSLLQSGTSWCERVTIPRMATVNPPLSPPL